MGETPSARSPTKKRFAPPRYQKPSSTPGITRRSRLSITTTEAHRFRFATRLLIHTTHLQLSKACIPFSVSFRETPNSVPLTLLTLFADCNPEFGVYKWLQNLERR